MYLKCVITIQIWFDLPDSESISLCAHYISCFPKHYTSCFPKQGLLSIQTVTSAVTALHIMLPKTRTIDYPDCDVSCNCTLHISFPKQGLLSIETVTSAVTARPVSLSECSVLPFMRNSALFIFLSVNIKAFRLMRFI